MEATDALNYTVQRALIVAAHSHKIKYWQKLPSQFKGITHLERELKVKTGCIGSDDWDLDQILIVWHSREGETAEKS